jgi:hypothetical protein
MRLGRALLAAGALLLIITAIVHGLGLGMVSTWLSGERGDFLIALWLMPSLDWTVAAAIWLVAAWRPGPISLLLAAIAALIPVGMLVAVLAVMGPGFFGSWLLTGALLLAGLGIWKLHRARP